MDARVVKNEINQVEVLRSRLSSIIGQDDDDDLFMTVIEGETQLVEMVNALVAQIAIDEAMAGGVKTHITAMRSRQERIETRVDALRDVLAEALVAMGVKKHEAPTGTVSLAPAPPKVVVTDACQVPDELWRQPDPVLDLAAIRQRLKDELPVPGAMLSNGGMSVRIRRA